MKAMFRRTLGVVAPAAALLLIGCSNTTIINADLVLEADDTARIDLHQRTQALDLLNKSDAAVRIYVLGKKDRVVSRMVLNGHDKVSLDLETARAVQFDNDSGSRAVVHWTLRNDDRIEYTMAMNPTN